MKLSHLPNSMMHQLSQQVGLKPDPDTGLLYGTKQGYQVVLRVPNNQFQAFISVSVCKNGEKPDQAVLDDFVKQHKEISSGKVSNHGVTFFVSPGMTKNSSIEKIDQAIQKIVGFLSQNRYENCCEVCGTTQSALQACVVEGTEALLCSSCFHNFAQQSNAQPQKPENLLGGIVGALLGSVLGVIAMVVVGQLGYIAAISGLIMAVCAIKGYEMLGGRLSMKGIVISCLILIVMTFVGNQLDWTVSLMQVAELDFFTAFRGIPVLLDEGIIEASAFYGNLALQYLFVLIGAVPTIINTTRSHKSGSITQVIG